MAGGYPAKVDDSLKGYFYQPTVLVNARLGMRIMHEETFGPAVAIMAFNTEEEAIQIANDTRDGLAAYLFTCDADRVLRAAKRLEHGIIRANDSQTFGLHVPFEEMKESGMGRENGAQGIEAFLKTQEVAIGL